LTCNQKDLLHLVKNVLLKIETFNAGSVLQFNQMFQLFSLPAVPLSLAWKNDYQLK